MYLFYFRACGFRLCSTLPIFIALYVYYISAYYRLLILSTLAFFFIFGVVVRSVERNSAAVAPSFFNAHKKSELTIIWKAKKRFFSVDHSKQEYRSEKRVVKNNNQRDKVVKRERKIYLKKIYRSFGCRYICVYAKRWRRQQQIKMRITFYTNPTKPNTIEKLTNATARMYNVHTNNTRQFEIRNITQRKNLFLTASLPLATSLRSYNFYHVQIVYNGRTFALCWIIEVVQRNGHTHMHANGLKPT